MGTRLRRRLLFRAAVMAVAALTLAAGVAASEANRFKSDLLGTNEFPVADLDGRGKASVRINTETGEVCFDVSWRDGGTANRGHIHRGAAGVNGPIVVSFFDLHLPEHAGDPRHDILEQRNELRDCVTADPAVLAEIVANPAGFYVNLHNARFPGGFVRGQLRMVGGASDLSR